MRYIALVSGKGAVLFLIIVACAGLLRADEEKIATLRVGTEVYTNVTVSRVTATDIYFTHSRGMGNAKLKSLEPELQKKFHYDPAKAQASETVQTEAKALYTKSMKDAEAIEADAAGNGSAEVMAHSIAAKSYLGQPAPSLVAEKWLTPAPDTAGKFVLVTFWATWSKPCREAIPRLNEFGRKFKGRLVIMALTDDPEAEVRKMTEPKMEFPIAVDTKQRAVKALAVERVPHAILVDPKGVVRFEGHPGYLNTRNLETLMERYGE